MGLDQTMVFVSENTKEEVVLVFRKFMPLQDFFVSKNIEEFVGEYDLSKTSAERLVKVLDKLILDSMLAYNQLGRKYPFVVNMLEMTHEERLVIRYYDIRKEIEELIMYLNKYITSTGKVTVKYYYDC